MLVGLAIPSLLHLHPIFPLVLERLHMLDSPVMIMVEDFAGTFLFNYSIAMILKIEDFILR